MKLRIWPRLLMLAAVATLAASPVSAASGSDCLGNPDLVKKAEACQSIVDLRKEPPAVIAAALRELGLLHMARGDRENCFAAFDQAIFLQPQNSSLYLDRAQAHMEFKDFAEALADAESALRLKPNYVTALATKGVVLGVMGQRRKAISAVTQAIKLESHNSAFYGLRGSLWQALGDFDQSIRDYSRSIRLEGGKSPESYYQRAVAYSMRGNYRRAIRDFTTAEGMGVVRSDLHLMRGTLLQLQEKQHRALADFERLVEIDPGNALGYNGRCWSLAKTGKLEAALKDCNTALQLDASVTNIWDSRALVYELMGKLDLAIADYEKSLSLDGKNTWAIDGLKRVKALQKKSAP